MDNRPPFVNTQFNQQYNSQPPPQFDSQSFSQQQQYDFQSFPQHYPFNPSYPTIPFNPQFFHGQTQFSSHLPYQTSSNLQQPTMQNKKKDKVQQKEKQANWSKEEDEILCKAWLRVSEDADQGTDQTRIKFWDRGLVEFNNILGYKSDRLANGLSNRWSTIQRCINKYSGYTRMVERYPTSGYNAEDEIQAIRNLYYDREKHHFKWDGCWRLLKDSSKWFQYNEEQEEKKKKIAQRKRAEIHLDVDETGNSSNPTTPATTPGSGTEPISLNDDDSPFTQGSHELPRPSGRKAAKNMRGKKNYDAINLFAEEFSNMRKDQKEIAEKELIMTRERDRIRREDKLEKDNRKYERKIMMTDPNSAPSEEGKIWIITQQKEILARTMQRGVRDGSSGSGV